MGKNPRELVEMKKVLVAVFSLARITFLPALVFWFVGVSVYRFTWDLNAFTEGTTAISWPFAALIIVLIFRDLLAERIKAITELRIGNTHASLKDPEVKGQQRRHDLEILIAKINVTEDEIASLNIFERDGGFSGFQPSKESILNRRLERLHEQLRRLDPDSVFLPK